MNAETPANTINKLQLPSGNKILFKGIITGCLILALLIPTTFVSTLVTEREQRKNEVISSVTSQWAQPQTFAGPFIYVPVRKIDEATHRPTTTPLILLPDQLTANANLEHQIRRRSIYNVVLYRTTINETGNFKFIIPQDVDSASIEWKSAKACFLLTDFKGIETEYKIVIDGKSSSFAPGIPIEIPNTNGLSAPIDILPDQLNRTISFSMQVNARGGSSLHFLPLAGNSEFNLTSTWESPSFDGNTLPAERTVNGKGFNAHWTFTKANMPFSTAFTNWPKTDLPEFGVSLIQPTDGYAKTNRCVKYGLLVIGLTISLCFITELLQRKPMHPVQYFMIGLAIPVFYTLLLALSEFIMFDYAYGIASFATITLISAYAWSHFGKLSIAFQFTGLLAALYAFIFVLIRLEDTALLIGSIGLFVILAIVMFVSRKINWYGNSSAAMQATQIS